jgi:hypothetical protein
MVLKVLNDGIWRLGVSSHQFDVPERGFSNTFRCWFGYENEQENMTWMPLRSY